MAVDACVKRTEALEEKNMIAERMLEREHASSVENVLRDTECIAWTETVVSITRSIN